MTTINVLDHGFVSEVTEPNSDLKIVNAARVSFAKKSETFTDKDGRLLKYLYTHKHWTPFAHCLIPVSFTGLYQFTYASERKFSKYIQEANPHNSYNSGWVSLWSLINRNFPVRPSLIEYLRSTFPNVLSILEHEDYDTWRRLTRPFADIKAGLEYAPPPSTHRNSYPYTFHIKAPIFVARQLFKHKYGFVENEVSRRYVDYEPEFYTPSKLRLQSKDNKQGSTDETISEIMTDKYSINVSALLRSTYKSCYYAYEDMLDAGVCKEQARMVLPQSMYTEWWLTSTRPNFNRLLALRLDAHTQWETRQYAKAISNIIYTLPVVEGDDLGDSHV